MKNKHLLIVCFIITFVSGFALSSFITASEIENKKVTGIGGIFFKCQNPKLVREWYSKNLGLVVNNYGSVFEWRQADEGKIKGFTQWSPFSDKTKYFAPSTKDFMINYRVANLSALQTELKANGVTICDTIQSYSYGKFLHIMDLEGNKIELWEPYDDEFSKISDKTTK